MPILNAVDRPECLGDVIALWRVSSATLGFLPVGAFEEFRDRGWLLVATTDEGAVQGYLAYRESRGWATIVHLCVGLRWRRTGVAQELFMALQSRTCRLYGIRLSCRTDFEANRLWPRLGFTAVGTRAGRASGRELHDWRLQFGGRDLFSRPGGIADERPQVAIDHNVFLDLHGQECRVDSESRLLSEDWVLDQINVVVTGAVLNELNACTSASERDRLRGIARTMEISIENHACFMRASNHFIALGLTEQDARQVARAASSDVGVFITRDERVLAHAAEAMDHFDLAIYRPADLISLLDETSRRDAYRPRRLAETRFVVARAGSQWSEDSLWAIFQNPGERKSGFLGRVREARSQPHERLIEVTASPDEEPIAISTSRSEGRHQVVDLLRAARGRFHLTYLRRELARRLEEAVEQSAEVLSVTPRCVSELPSEVLGDLGFVECAGGGFVRVVQRGIVGLAEAERTTAEILERFGLAVEGSEYALSDDAPEVATRFERILSPLKIDMERPTFIVPIKPRFATMLFGLVNDQTDLFGPPQELAFSLDHVYYRAARPQIVEAPARVLWYVSGDGKQADDRMRIRAVSQIREVAVGQPSPLYRRFAPLGVYRWPQVLELAKHDLSSEIMCIRFDRTELINCGPTFSEIQSTLERHGTRNNLQSPVRISHAAFCDLYRPSIRR